MASENGAANRAALLKSLHDTMRITGKLIRKSIWPAERATASRLMKRLQRRRDVFPIFGIYVLFCRIVSAESDTCNDGFCMALMNQEMGRPPSFLRVDMDSIRSSFQR